MHPWNVGECNGWMANFKCVNGDNSVMISETPTEQLQRQKFCQNYQRRRNTDPSIPYSLFLADLIQIPRAEFCCMCLWKKVKWQVGRMLPCNANSAIVFTHIYSLKTQERGDTLKKCEKRAIEETNAVLLCFGRPHSLVPLWDAAAVTLNHQCLWTCSNAKLYDPSGDHK